MYSQGDQCLNVTGQPRRLTSINLICSDNFYPINSVVSEDSCSYTLQYSSLFLFQFIYLIFILLNLLFIYFFFFFFFIIFFFLCIYFDHFLKILNYNKLLIIILNNFIIYLILFYFILFYFILFQ